MCTKWSGRTLLLTGWLREVCGNMINFTKGRELALRKLGRVLSFFFAFSFVGCHFLSNSSFLWFSYSR
jgi:hypothetical protein